MAQNLNFLKTAMSLMFVIASSDYCVYKMDFNKVLNSILQNEQMLPLYVRMFRATGIYVVRRRQLIELLEKCQEEDRYDFVKDILIRYKELKRIYGYKINTYWSNISTVDAYYRTNMDFLKPEVRDYFFNQYPSIQSKIDDLPPAKYNPGSQVKNSLISSDIMKKWMKYGAAAVMAAGMVLGGSMEALAAHLEGCIINGLVKILSYLKKYLWVITV